MPGSETWIGSAERNTSMDAVTLARLQFGTTIVYHYLFVPLTLGSGLLIAIMGRF